MPNHFDDPQGRFDFAIVVDLIEAFTTPEVAEEILEEADKAEQLKLF